MITTYIFVERAGKAEIMNAMLNEGYSILDWAFMVFDEVEVSGGTELHCEFDTQRNAQAFVFELEGAGFDVQIKPEHLY
tara:strand:- start:201 stop:437 length:237 start_codon:yes stop_codon:yes gene_type:complete